VTAKTLPFFPRFWIALVETTNMLTGHSTTSLSFWSRDSWTPREPKDRANMAEATPRASCVRAISRSNQTNRFSSSLCNSNCRDVVLLENRGGGEGRGGREIRKSSPTEPPSVEPPSSLTHMTHSVRFLLTRMSISSSRSVIRVISRYLALSPEKVVSRVPCTSNPNRTNRNRLNSPVDSRWPSTTFRCVKLSFVFGSAIASHLCIFM